MDISLYNLVYIITNIFGTYIIYKFMSIFFNRKEVNRKIELLSYLGYFIMITIVYLFIKIPVVMMICNISAFIGLSLNYKANIKKRILAVTYIYLISMCVEIIVIILLSGMRFTIFSENEYSISYSLIVLKVVTYIVVLVLGKFVNVKHSESVPMSYWVCIILMPVSSLYIILILFQTQDIVLLQVIIGLIFMLLINFATFYLFDRTLETLSNKIERVLFTKQNEYYNEQFNLMRNSLKSTREIKHDLINHLTVIYSLVHDNEIEYSLDHISKMLYTIGEKKEHAHSGNIIVDSILNFKLQEVEQKNIKIALDLNVPEEMDIPSFDMTIILGNLLDNAVSAVCKLTEERYINIIIKYDRGRFILNIDNPFEGKIAKEDDTFLTTKEDKANHGIGLQSIKTVLAKYNGTIDISHNEKVFSVTLFMYIELSESNGC